MKKKLLVGFAPKALAALAILPFATGAFAADLPMRSEAPYYDAPPMFTWTGFYLGANAGYGFGGGTSGGSQDFGSQSGGMIGLTAGYNFQSGPLVAGVEADIDYSGVAGSNSPASSVYTSGNVTGFGTVRARFGYAYDRTLFYITGGYAGANMRGTLADSNFHSNLFYNQSNYLNGYVLGLGVEYALNRNLSIKAEYLYSNFGTENYFGGTRDSVSAGTNFSTIRAGVNYHF